MNNKTYIDALDYAKDVASRMENISTEEYFLRRERTTRKMILEEWALACYGKILYHPDRRIKVSYRGNESDGIDAEIIVEGNQKLIEGWDDETPIEIVSVQYPKFHLVLKELGETGSSVGSLSGFDDDIVKFIPEAIESLKKKYRNAYPSNTIILCAIFPEKPFGRDYWNRLLDGISEKLTGSVKYKTVILDTFTCQHFNIRAS